jgi:hypothetical protein
VTKRRPAAVVPGRFSAAPTDPINRRQRRAAAKLTKEKSNGETATAKNQ